MTALAGVLFRRSPPEDGAVKRMLQAAPHRGTQSEVASTGRCILGVVNEPDHREATVASRCGLVVAFAGVLDNPEEIARLSGDRTTTGQDAAAIVLSAFESVGEPLLSQLRGSFSCLISDGEHVWGFRDQLGYETLFYREDERGVYLGTEAKQVLAGAGVAPRPNMEQVEAIFFGAEDDATKCALRGVTRLLAGTLLTAGRDGSITTSRYWDPSDLLESGRLSEPDIGERFHELFTQAVRRSLTGCDVVAMSGGIDSPPIAAFGNREHLRLYGRPLPAIAEVHPSSPSSDESEYITLAAERLGVPLHTYEPGRQKLDRLQYWVKLFDGPFSTVGPEGNTLRCRQVRALGFRTLLTGHFAEHVITAGQRYLLSHLIWRGRLGAAAHYLLKQRRAGVGGRRIISQLRYAFTPALVERRRDVRRAVDGLPTWVSAQRLAQGHTMAITPKRDRWVRFQLPFFGASAAGEADVYSHAVHGVRPRRPWTDVDLWEFFLSLPAETKFPDQRSKALARNLLRGEVPDEILDRRKKTFATQYFERMCQDYPALRDWLIDPEYRMPGVDYPQLARELDKEEMSFVEYLWARDLAAVHAFMDLWS